MTAKPEALAELAASRRALLDTVAELKARVSPPQLAEDVMSFLDPDLTLLGRIRSSIGRHRLLSLAVLAGAGWLVGAPRRNKDKPRSPREPDPVPPRATSKENNNDSGKISGSEWRDLDVATAEESRAEGRRPQGRGKTEAGSGRGGFARHKERRESRPEA